MLKQLIEIGGYLSQPGAQLRGGWRVLKHPPSLKKVCPVIRPDPMTFFIRGGGTCTCTIMDTSIISLQPSQTHTYHGIRRPACLYFKIHRQLTIVEVLSEGTLLMSVAEIHVN